MLKKKTQTTKKTNTVTTKESEEKMNTKETKKETLLTVVRKATQTGQVEQIIGALNAVDIELFKKGTQSNKTKDFIEILLYNSFVEANEDTEKSLSLIFEDTKTLRILSNILPYILGCKEFCLSYNKQDKLIELNFKMNNPYSTYREGLEAHGLLFVTNNKAQQQEEENSAKQETLAEVNSLLAAVGLPHYAL